jgi:hypothetical protein
VGAAAVGGLGGDEAAEGLAGEGGLALAGPAGRAVLARELDDDVPLAGQRAAHGHAPGGQRGHAGRDGGERVEADEEIHRGYSGLSTHFRIRSRS